MMGIMAREYEELIEKSPGKTGRSMGIPSISLLKTLTRRALGLN
jgi:hypothetical protein